MCAKQQVVHQFVKMMHYAIAVLQILRHCKWGVIVAIHYLKTFNNSVPNRATQWGQD